MMRKPPTPPAKVHGTFGSHAKRCILRCLAGVMLIVGAFVQGQTYAPYPVDPATLHLWHLDETDWLVMDSVPGADNLYLFTQDDAVLGFSSLPGLQGAARINTAATTAGALIAGEDISFSYANPTTGAFTYEALIKFDASYDPLAQAAAVRNMEIISLENDGTTNRVFQFRYVGRTTTAAPKLEFTHLTSNQVIAANVPITGADAVNNVNWFHVAVTYNGNAGDSSGGGNLKMYWTKLASGVTQARLLGSGTLGADLPSSAADFAIGNEARGIANEGFPGLIDEVRISSIARTPDDFLFPGVTVVGASGWEIPNVPANTRDGNLSTRWSAQGDGQWITYDLGATMLVESVGVAFLSGDTRTSRFDVLVSNDNVSWSTARAGIVSSGTTASIETFDLPSDPGARYVRIVGHGNSVSNWNSITEVVINAATMSDSDNDGLPDAWEMGFFGNLSQTATGDFDSDSYNNLAEYEAGSSPADAAFTPLDIDADGDTLPDVWEEANLGDLSSYAYDDNDSDGYTNQAEMLAGTNPLSTGSTPPWQSPRLTLLRDSVVATDALLMGTGGIYGRAINGVPYSQQILLTFKGYQYTAWYNTVGTTQHVWLARRTVSGTNVGPWEKFNTGSEFSNGDEGAWDGHNVIAFGICPADGTLHLAWDHHGNTLRYRRSIAGLCTTNTAAWGTAGMLNAEQNWLVASGQVESDVTYPMFTATPSGGLVMNRRIGTSGVGDQLLHIYNPINGVAGGNWITPKLFLSRTGTYQGSVDRNAYVNGVDFSPDGKMHVTWTWREGASTSNHDICYAYSPDNGIKWYNTFGTLIADTSLGQSINLNTPGIVIKSLDVNQLLINQQAQCVDNEGGVHVLMFHRREEAAYAYPNVTTAAYSTRGTAYHHYYRDPVTGAWSQRRLPPDAYPVGSRPTVGFDAQGNLYAVYLSYNVTTDLTAGRGSGRLVIATASKASQYSDWEVVKVIETNSQGQPLQYLFGGEPLIDHARLLSDGVLSVYIQEFGPSSSAAIGTPLHVYDFQTSSNSAPTLSAIADQTLQSGTASSPIALTVGDTETAPGNLTLSGSAANPSLIPAGNIVFSGTGASRSAVITPVAGASGTTSVTFVISDGVATSSQTFNVTVLSAGDLWRQKNFGADWATASIAGDSADPEGDGVPNLLERALGGNPNLAEQDLLPAVDDTQPVLTIRYRRAKAATDLNYTVQESPDLSPGSWTTAQGTSKVLSDDGAVEVIGFTVPVEGSARKFLRVQISKP